MCITSILSIFLLPLNRCGFFLTGMEMNGPATNHVNGKTTQSDTEIEKVVVLDAGAQYGKVRCFLLSLCSNSFVLTIVGHCRDIKFLFYYLNHRNCLDLGLVQDSFSLALLVCHLLLLLNRLIGQVVLASASGAEDPGFESHLQWDFSGSSHTTT